MSFKLLGMISLLTITSSALLLPRQFSKDNSWDYLLFVQRWPQTICVEVGDSECVIPDDVSGWVIHGLWPNRKGSELPDFCNDTNKFNPEKVANLRNTLLVKWPNLEAGKTADSLWEHEWDKHGTCAKSLSTLSDEEKYFSATLKFQDMFPIHDWLSANGIAPSDTKGYSPQSIINVLKTNIVNGQQIQPQIRCAYKKESFSSNQERSKPCLDEIRICLDKEFNAFDCPDEDLSVGEEGSLYDTGPCPDDEDIFIPVSIWK